AFLPPLPVPGASAAHLGIIRVLAETSSGMLLALGVDPEQGMQVPGGDAAPAPDLYRQQWLWAWDPRRSQWTVFDSPLPEPWERCTGTCWEGFLAVASDSMSTGTYLWVRGSGTGTTQLYRIFLPVEGDW